MLSPLFSEKLRQQGLANIAASAGAELPERLGRARREGDTKKRLADYRALDRAISDTGMVIPLFQDKMVIIFNRRLGDIQPNPLGRFFLYEIRTK
jgi:MarR-like DNA-binding transcriptional regulator SgrR of sgrS sRNA